jgi:hypothetical protein
VAFGKQMEQIVQSLKKAISQREKSDILVFNGLKPRLKTFRVALRTRFVFEKQLDFQRKR